MSSPPKCLWIGRQTKVNALVGKNDQTKRLLVIYSDYSFLLITFFTAVNTPLLTSQHSCLKRNNTKQWRISLQLCKSWLLLKKQRMSVWIFLLIIEAVFF